AMEAQQRRCLEGRFGARDWHGGGRCARSAIKDFNVDGSEIRRWSLERVQRDERAKPPVIHSMWRAVTVKSGKTCHTCHTRFWPSWIPIAGMERKEWINTLTISTAAKSMARYWCLLGASFE